MEAERNELKRKFFAQYYGQSVFTRNSYTQEGTTTEVVGGLLDTDISDAFLLLKPLSAITDEDAIELAEFCGWHGLDAIQAKGVVLALFVIASNDLMKSQMIFDLSDVSSAVDKIRSMGYAYKWLKYSVKQQEEMGWIKLINK